MDPRAGDGARTHDPQLGKLMLYQLSYAREASSVAGLRPLAASRAPECAVTQGSPRFRLLTTVSCVRQAIRGLAIDARDAHLALHRPAFDLVDSLTRLWFTLAFQRKLGRRLAFKMLGGH